jgi:hypothetical protein
LSASHAYMIYGDSSLLRAFLSLTSRRLAVRRVALSWFVNHLILMLCRPQRPSVRCKMFVCFFYLLFISTVASLSSASFAVMVTVLLAVQSVSLCVYNSNLKSSAASPTICFVCLCLFVCLTCQWRAFPCFMTHISQLV